MTPMTDSEFDIVLKPVSGSGFRTAIQNMGLDYSRSQTLASSTGKSITILRRQLAKRPLFT